MVTVVDWTFPPPRICNEGLATIRSWFRDSLSTCIHAPAPDTRAIVLAVDNAIYCAACAPVAAAYTITTHPPCYLCQAAPATVAATARPTTKLLGFRTLVPLCTTCAPTGDNE